MRQNQNFLIGIKMNQKGLTLIEILVVVGVFSGLTTLISGIFLTNFEMQRRTMAIQKTMGETSYAVEYMTRAIRMAQNDHNGECLEEGREGFTYGIPVDGSGQDQQGIQFINHRGECVKFFLNSDRGVIKKAIRDDGSDNWSEYDLSSGLLKFNSFKTEANVVPEDNSNLYVDQPSVTLLLDVDFLKSEYVDDELWWSSRIQTTVTRRSLDIERNI